MTFARQLQLLVLTSLVLCQGLTLANLRLRTFPALKEEFRKDLSQRPFFEARRQRCRDLEHFGHLLTVDVSLNRQLVRLTASNPYLEQVGALSSDQLEHPDSELRQRLQRVREESLFQIHEISERLFLKTDSTSDEVHQIECCADLFLLVEPHGVILSELQSQPQIATPHYQRHPRQIPEPRQLTFLGRPFADQAFANLDREANQTVVGCFEYGGQYFQGMALDLPVGKGLLVLADRLDQNLARQAAAATGTSTVALLLEGKQGRMLGTSAPQQEALSHLPWHFGEDQVLIQGQEWQSLMVPLDHSHSEDVRLVLLKPTQVLYQVALQQWEWLAAIVLSMTILFVAISSYLASRMAHPIQQLALALRRVGQGEREVPLALAGPGEVRAASQAFHQMLRDLKEKETLEAQVRRLDELRHQADLSDEHVRNQTQFGRFVVVERLGAGGMATVYRALPLDTLAEADQVAIKVIHRQFAADQDFQARLRREFKVLQDLHHPGIVSVLECGELNGILYMVMEFVRGELLSQRLQRGPVAFEEFPGLLRQMLAALQFAHSRGVIHRDLKPENMMLTPQGQVKMMDFGLATGADFSHLTATGVAFGTPAYVAPEQLAGRADPRSDQYSLGIVFYEMLTGQTPFAAPDAMALIQLQMTAAPPEPDLLRADIPPAWSAILLKMLEKNPDHRYPDLKQLGQVWESVF